MLILLLLFGLILLCVVQIALIGPWVLSLEEQQLRRTAAVYAEQWKTGDPDTAVVSPRNDRVALVHADDSWQVQGIDRGRITLEIPDASSWPSRENSIRTHQLLGTIAADPPPSAPEILKQYVFLDRRYLGIAQKLVEEPTDQAAGLPRQAWILAEVAMPSFLRAFLLFTIMLISLVLSFAVAEFSLVRASTNPKVTR